MPFELLIADLVSHAEQNFTAGNRLRSALKALLRLLRSWVASLWAHARRKIDWEESTCLALLHREDPKVLRRSPKGANLRINKLAWGEACVFCKE